MHPARVPTVLRDRLGEDASAALAEMVYTAVLAGIDEALHRATDRFERRLAEEVAGLRVDFRPELAATRVEFRTDLAAMRAELLKWSFLFWTGQLVAIAGLMALMR